MAASVSEFLCSRILQGSPELFKILAVMKHYRKMSAMKHYKRIFFIIGIFSIYLSLDENIGKTCCDIKVKDSNSDNGVDILLSILKSLFAKI